MMSGIQNQAAWRSPYFNQKLHETTTFIRSINVSTESCNFLEYHRVKFVAGHSIGYPSSWSLFLVSCGSKGETSRKGSPKIASADYFGLFLDQMQDSIDYQPLFEEQAVGGNSFEFIIRYLVEVIGKDDMVITSREVETVPRDNVTKGYWGWRKVTPILHNHPSEDNSLSSSRELQLRITFTMIGRPKDTLTKIPSSHMNLLAKEHDKERDIAMNIYNLAVMGNTTKPDVTIQTTFGSPYFVHQEILAARSPVFSRMFDTSMKEGFTRKAQIDEISFETMECLLRHVYTGQVEIEWFQNTKVASELVYASEKYWLSSLRDYCDQNLVQAATRKNCLILLELASLHDLDNATNDLIKFVQDKMISISSSPSQQQQPTEFYEKIQENRDSGDEQKL